MKTLARYLTHNFNKINAPILAVTAVLAMVACCQMAPAQSGAGSIQGTVTDSSGAVIPGASIHVVNPATGVVTDSKSNGVGFYQVPELFTGAYDVTITALGFKTYATRIDLLVAQNAVINPVMTAGTVTQEVTVSGNAVELTTTDSGTLGTTLENQRINQLPMNGRDLTTLAQENTPGMSAGGERINGMLYEAIDYVSDGVSTTNSQAGGEVNSILQDPDSVQEVKVDALDASAQYATPATVVLTTKSGTNSLHGTFFETARNNAIGVAKSRQNPSDYVAPHLVRNEFGASVGGPIILPHVYHGKDKSFWFFAYERYSLASQTSLLLTTPTTAMRQGNFSGLVNSSGVLQTLYDPATTNSSSACAATPANPANAYCRESFTQEYGETGVNVNSVPIGRESPVAKLYLAMFPQPTNTKDPLVSDNLTYNSPTLDIIPNITFRLDHVFNDNNRAYVRYTNNLANTDANGNGNAENLAISGIPAGAAMGRIDYPEGSMLAGIGYTHVFSPTFFAETVASEQWNYFRNVDGIGPPADYESELGLPNNFGTTGFPSTTGLIMNPNGSQSNSDEDQLTVNLDENLTKTVGRHQMQFGGRFHHERMGVVPEGVVDTQAFDGLATGVYNPGTAASYGALANTGEADGDFFIGSADTYTIHLQPGHIHYHQNELDGYFQDNYHVSRKLTLNLGLRYEAHPGLFIKYGLATTYDLKNDAFVTAVPPSTLIAEGYTTPAIISNMEEIGLKFETPAEAGFPASLADNYYLNFLPRAGAAYLLGGKYGTVLRGAYGRYTFNSALSEVANHYMSQAPFAGAYSQSYTAANQAVDNLPDELLRYNDPVEFGEEGVNTANVVNTSSTTAILPGGLNFFSDNPNFPPSTVTEANVTIEQPLKGNSALAVSWVGTFGSGLDTQLDYNNAPSTYEWEMATGTIPPTGGASVIGTPQQDTYAATATRPYNNTTLGSAVMVERSGWSNDNALQVSYQRLFHHGFAYQVAYVYSKAMRMGGDAEQDGPASGSTYGTGYSAVIYPVANYPGFEGTAGAMSPVASSGPIYPGAAAPAPPAGTPLWQDYHALDRFEGYQLDDTVPKMHVLFNGIVDLPFGTGKRFLGNANRFLNELVGGFQLAGDGTVGSQEEQLDNPPTGGNWGATSPLVVWKHKYPIQDCRSGVCENSYMWYNGYLAPTVLPAPLGTCTTNCVNGLPTSYVPYQTPIDNTPGTTYYGDNDVVVTLANGSKQTVPYPGSLLGACYLCKTMVNGPNNWTIDTSIFKVFPITERMNLRVNMDVFNALNVQGWENPGYLSGVETNLTSYNTPRQIQLTARLTF